MRPLKMTLLLLIGLSLAAVIVMAQQDEDPHLWLEEVDGTRAMDWVKAHNKRTCDHFEAMPGFDDLYQRNLTIYNADDRIATPEIRGDFVYNFWKDATHPRGVWRRALLSDYLKRSPQWEVLIDVDALSATDGEKWVLKGVSWLHPNFNRCMVNLSPGGGDAVTSREFDVREKVFVKEGFVLPTAKSQVAWKDENTLYVGTNFGAGSMTQSGYARITKVWKRGTALASAETLYEGQETDMGVWTYTMHAAHRTYVLVYRMLTFYENEIFVHEKDRLIRLALPADAQVTGFFKNQLMVSLKSDWDVQGTQYPQGAVIAIDYDAFLAGDRAFHLLVAPDAQSSVSGISTTENHVIVNRLTRVRSALSCFTLDGATWTETPIQSPDMGTLSIVSTQRQADGFFYQYEDFLTPSTLYFSKSPSASAQKIQQLPAFFDADNLVAAQHEAVSKDGTRIPYFIVHQKGLVPDGSHPTLLYGYGGFEISEVPEYGPSVGASWLEKGGVYVVANIRGGGEFGPAWHQAGLKANRQRVYDDFIAVSEALIESKITTPAHLGVYGGSNGGLLVGVMMTQRPELFNAVVCAVPLLDMKRYNKLLAGASWMGEYGNPDLPEEWAFIQKYSPYHNLHPQVKYPKVLFTTSTRDDRVHPGHARKMARKMETLAHPFYYFENIEGGHGGVSTHDQRARRSALIYSYLMDQLK